jgi:hypothetical protein
VIWLHDVRGARDKHDLMRFDASGAVSANMFGRRESAADIPGGTALARQAIYLCSSVFICVHLWFEIFLAAVDGQKRNEPQMNTDEHR